MQTGATETAHNSNIGYWEQVLQAPTPEYQQLFDAERKYVISHIPKDAKVLDIGCGEGRNMRSIYEATPYVYGIDIDEKAVQDARQNFKDVNTVQVVQGEAKNLPFENDFFDVVTFLMIIGNLDKDKEKSFQEAARVLKPNGFILASVFSETAFEERMKIYEQVKAPIKRIEGTTVIFDESIGANVSEQFSIEQIEKMAGQAGLKVVEWERVGKLALLCKLVKR